MGLKVLVPLLEGMSLEENDDLQELWARLLVNASDAEASSTICQIAREALKSFSRVDVRVLDALFREVSSGGVPSDAQAWGNYRGMPKMAAETAVLRQFRPISRDRLLADTKLSLVEFELSFDCITRFNLIEAPERHDLDGRKLDRDHYAFTRLGWQVMNLLVDTPYDTSGAKEKSP